MFFVCYRRSLYYPHMPTHKVWIYWLLFVCLCLCVCTVTDLSGKDARIKLAASNVARWFIGVLGSESPILGNFAPQEAQNWMNWPATGKYSLGYIFLTLNVMLRMHRSCNITRCVDVGLTCVDRGQSPLMYLFLCSLLLLC